MNNDLMTSARSVSILQVRSDTNFLTDGYEVGVELILKRLGLSALS